MNTLDRVARFFASLKLTVICLAFAAVLVFLGTIAQVEEGLYNAQGRYFRSVLIYWSPAGADWKVPVFPGGYLIGGLLLVNLVTSLVERLRAGRGRWGLHLVHVGVILLLAGQFATDLLSVESHMRLKEGQPRQYSESGSQTELAVIDTSDPQSDEVFPIPERELARQSEIRVPELPFAIRVRSYYQNCRLQQRQGEAASKPPAATQGFGTELVVQPAPPTVKMDERNVPGAVVELLTPQGSLGTWLVALFFDEPQPVTVQGKTYTLQLRPTRYYKSHTITLLKFRHDKYRGTDIPKNFSSRVRLQRPDTGEDREVLIYMNNPLRYAGETYYQSGYDERDPQVSILQVVRNPGWLTPYLSCLLVGLGLMVQFTSHLVEFVRQRKSA
jgi:hypothetical protein